MRMNPVSENSLVRRCRTGPRRRARRSGRSRPGTRTPHVFQRHDFRSQLGAAVKRNGRLGRKIRTDAVRRNAGRKTASSIQPEGVAVVFQGKRRSVRRWNRPGCCSEATSPALCRLAVFEQLPVPARLCSNSCRLLQSRRRRRARSGSRRHRSPNPQPATIRNRWPSGIAVNESHPSLRRFWRLVSEPGRMKLSMPVDTRDLRCAPAAPQRERCPTKPQIPVIRIFIRRAVCAPGASHPTIRQSPRRSTGKRLT